LPDGAGATLDESGGRLAAGEQDVQNQARHNAIIVTLAALAPLRHLFTRTVSRFLHLPADRVPGVQRSPNS